MVMDVYDHLPPTGAPQNAAYILQETDDVLCAVAFHGVFDCLEAAMHALTHRALFGSRSMEENHSWAVSRVQRNSLAMQPLRVVSWVRRAGEHRPGCPNGEYQMHDAGLRTHSVEA